MTHPTPIVKDETICDRLDEWEALIRRLSAYGEDFDLLGEHQLLLNALEQMFVNKADVYEAVERSANAADSASLKDRFTDIACKLKTYGDRRTVQVMNRQPTKRQQRHSGSSLALPRLECQ